MLLKGDHKFTHSNYLLIIANSLILTANKFTLSFTTYASITNAVIIHEQDFFVTFCINPGGEDISSDCSGSVPARPALSGKAAATAAACSENSAAHTQYSAKRTAAANAGGPNYPGRDQNGIGEISQSPLVCQTDP